MYFPLLIKSLTFIQALQKGWDMVRNKIDISLAIEELFRYISHSLKSNFDRWEYKEDKPYWRAST